MKPIEHYYNEPQEEQPWWNREEQPWWRSPGPLALCVLIVLAVAYWGVHTFLWTTNGTTNADRATEAIAYVREECGNFDTLRLHGQNPWYLSTEAATEGWVVYNIVGEDQGWPFDGGKVIWTGDEWWGLECPEARPLRG